MSDKALVATTIIRRKQVEKRVALSKSVLYERMAANQFPKPINLGGRAVGWIESEIEEWLSDRIRASRGGCDL